MTANGCGGSNRTSFGFTTNATSGPASPRHANRCYCISPSRKKMC